MVSLEEVEGSKRIMDPDLVPCGPPHSFPIAQFVPSWTLFSAEDIVLIGLLAKNAPLIPSIIMLTTHAWGLNESLPARQFRSGCDKCP